MSDKLSVTFVVDTRYRRKTFKFIMTNHLQDKTSNGSETACRKIADWIVDNAETSIWMNMPLWHITGGWRIVLIEPTNPLWHLLDSESKTKPLNWLIFKNHPKRSSEILVTHFGPFGTRKNDEFKENFRKTKNRFFEKMAEHLAILNDEKVSEEQKKKSKKAHQAHIDNHYIKVKRNLYSEIDIIKATITDIIRFIYGTAEAGVVLTTNLGLALAPSAIKIGCKVLIKETVVILSKQLAKEIAIISAKVAGKEAGKVAGKKVPVVGLAIGIGLGAFRLFKGDITGAGLELASGAASTIPGAGTVASFAIDGLLACKDVVEALEKLKYHQFALERASSDIVRLIDQMKVVEEEHKVVRKVFFEEGFNYGDRGEEFVQAFQYLACRVVS